MTQTTSIHLDDDDGVLCRHTLTEYEPEGHPLVQLQHGGQQVDLHLTRGRLERLERCIAAYLAAHPASTATCIDCEGEGVRLEDGIALEPCPSCHGRGRVPMVTDGEESLEEMQLQEISLALTEAAQACGIDPDGMDDLMVIHALAAQAPGRRPVDVGLHD